MCVQKNQMSNNQFTNAISNLNQINANVTNVSSTFAAAAAAVVAPAANFVNNNVNGPTSQAITTSNVILQTLKRRNTKVVVPLDERVSFVSSSLVSQLI